ncbi:MAG: transcription termination/antitermination protein NusA [Spirochaetes bacterium]|nr:transcription termination/antitermination protein NusA [Spirochaetota bacterium]
MSKNFFEALHEIATDKGIPREYIEQIVESAMLSAFKKQYGMIDNVRVVFDREKNTVKVVSKKMAVKTVRNRAEEIQIAEAVKIAPGAVLGDEIEVEENPLESFGRIAAQTAKQVIIQKIKEAEKNIIYDEFVDKEGELINGFLQRKTKDAIYIDLGRTEGILPAREQSPLEHYKIGDRVKALILTVQKNTKGPSIILSRTHPKFIEKLFEMEIPEIYDGVVRIVNIVREQGLRTKVAVTSERDDVDSVGACVGMKGIRIQSIVRELEGEKIDVVEWFDDRKIMASNALTPAKVHEIVEKSDGGVIAVVDNDQKHLALGKVGHNVRLASRLCGFDIDIKTEDQYRDFLSSSESRAIVEQLFSRASEDETPLSELPGLEPRTIKLLENGGVFSVEDLVEKSLEELMAIDGIGEKTAKKILEIIEESVDFEDTQEEGEEDSGTEEKPAPSGEETGEKAETVGEDGQTEVKNEKAEDKAEVEAEAKEEEKQGE